MPFIKGRDGKPQTVNNPLEGAVGNVDLNRVTVDSLISSGNVTGNFIVGNGSLLTGITTGQLVNDSGFITSATANVVSVNGQTGTVVISTGNVSAGNVSYTESNPGDWAIPVANVQAALDEVANTVANFETGTGFTFLGPFSNDAGAAAGGVNIGQVYYNNAGGLVVRQT